ncbi:hypothetical protein BDV96DRAFT_260019 [Lophiotrema nucula]|uniref:Uncharacterized protein n=1 Tax=Lophiotrema nucula TaxID=690887 RepID=A0A6A5YQY9_9PLEO|nr:hypothetical protein BDV96DRAFT_260019 [Lophiotrema nucula]
MTNLSRASCPSYRGISHLHLEPGAVASQVSETCRICEGLGGPRGSQARSASQP